MKLIASIYSLNSREGMHLYYSIKERFGHKIDKKENFIDETANKLIPLLKGYNNIIIPESSNRFLEEVVKKTGINYTVIKKNNIDIIKKNIDFMNLQKKEKETHLRRINDMGNVFKINALKSNQRKKYFDILFEKQNVEQDSVIVDDSHFSGTTLTALELATGCKEAICIFSKQ